MIQLQSLSRALILITCLFSSQVFAAEPAENRTIQLTRNASSDLNMTGSFTKNLYRDEEYQANYTVDIPYEVEEEYTVDIPYTVDVPYTEWVTDYKSEYVCHDVTKYDKQCHNEVKCYLIPGRPVCREVEECGVNAHGQPICKTRTVCEDGASEQRCEDHQVCVDRPYTDRECGYEQVAYQREVSGIRQETHYRQETRTHIVTRYRQETRCCVTKTRPVYDKQIQFQVSIRFPQGAALLTSEAEEIKLILDSADMKSARVSVQATNSVFGYKVANVALSGANMIVELALQPKWDTNNGGLSTLKNVILNWAKDVKYFQFSLRDSLISPRITTTYKLIVLDDKNKKIEEQDPKADANGAVNLLLRSGYNNKNAKIKVKLQVTRSGATITNSQINFETVVSPTK